MGRRVGGVDILHEDTCDEMAQLLAGCNFEHLSPDNRVKVLDLILKKSMAEDLYEIRRWFELSSLFDGIPNG